MRAWGRVGRAERARREARMAALTGVGIALGAGVGAALMFLLDPEDGRARRARVRESYRLLGSSAAGVAERHGGELFQKIRSSAQDARERKQAREDLELAKRVRTRLVGVASHSSSIGVVAQNGVVLLAGPVLASEVDALVTRVRAVPGVVDVEVLFDVYASPARIPLPTLRHLEQNT